MCFQVLTSPLPSKRLPSAEPREEGASAQWQARWMTSRMHTGMLSYVLGRLSPHMAEALSVFSEFCF